MVGFVVRFLFSVQKHRNWKHTIYWMNLHDFARRTTFQNFFKFGVLNRSENESACEHTERDPSRTHQNSTKINVQLKVQTQNQWHLWVRSSARPHWIVAIMLNDVKSINNWVRRQYTYVSVGCVHFIWTALVECVALMRQNVSEFRLRSILANHQPVYIVQKNGKTYSNQIPSIVWVAVGNTKPISWATWTVNRHLLWHGRNVIAARSPWWTHSKSRFICVIVCIVY